MLISTSFPILFSQQIDADEREFAAENAFRADEPFENSKPESLQNDSIFGGPEVEKEASPKYVPSISRVSWLTYTRAMF